MTTAGRALVVRGGWPGHVPVEATDLFVPFLREAGFDVRVSDSTAVYADAAVMTGSDLVVQCWSMGELGPGELDGLRAAVRAGTGLAGWHGGIIGSFPDPTYLQLTGGVFAAHPAAPGSERVGDRTDVFLPHRIEFTDRNHPITRGLADIDLVTEQYWVLTDEHNEVLATTTHAVGPDRSWARPITVPAVWTRQWGAGRVFVATPGHDVVTLEHPTVRTLIERGLLWAAGRTG